MQHRDSAKLIDLRAGKRQWLLESVLAGLLAICGQLNDAWSAEATTPNLVFVFVDDMGYGDLGCFRDLGRASPIDHGPSLTPNIDQLASEGLRLTQFYVASPICSPSRVAITTGQFPGRWLINSYLNNRADNASRGMANWLDPQAPCIAREFQRAGYATAHFGKWHMGGGRDVGEAPLPTEYGFDESLVSFEGLGDRILPPGGLSEQSAKLGRGNIQRVKKHEQTAIYVDRCIDFMERNREHKFYLHLWLNDVHDGHVPAPGEAEKFADRTQNPNERKFFAVLSDMDWQLGRLFAKLTDLGLDEKTLVCLTSDNGPTAWPNYYKSGNDPAGSTAGFRGRKWSLYEGGIRMPFIARWKGRIAANQIDRTHVLGSVDLLPTFLACAGLPATAVNGDGGDASTILLAKPEQRSSILTSRPALFWEYGRDDTYLKPGLPDDQSPNLAIRDGQWKLLVNADGSRTELYAVGTEGEIDEHKNVAEAYPEVTSRLKTRLLEWRQSLPALTQSGN